MIDDFIVKLKETHGVAILSSIEPSPSDIDIFVRPDAFTKVINIGLNFGFVCAGKTAQHCVLRKFIQGKLYILDLITDFNLYTENFPKLKLTSKGNEQIGFSPALHKGFKRLLQGRLNELEPVGSEIAELLQFINNADNYKCLKLNNHSNITTADQIWSLISDGYFLSCVYQRLKGYCKVLGKGTSFAFIGPDGSGKSFIISHLREIGPTRNLYMGDFFFRLQRFYNFLMKIPSPLNRIVYLFYFFENITRSAHVGIFKFMGYIVLIDRFPGTNRNVDKTGILGTINRLTFKFTPKPDYLILLKARPEIVFARKQELTIDQISAHQFAIQNLIKSNKCQILNTENLDDSLNTILKLAYHEV
jgi:thymidylate kinase